MEGSPGATIPSAEALGMPGSSHLPVAGSLRYIQGWYSQWARIAKETLLRPLANPMCRALCEASENLGITLNYSSESQGMGGDDLYISFCYRILWKRRLEGKEPVGRETGWLTWSVVLATTALFTVPWHL